MRLAEQASLASAPAPHPARAYRADRPSTPTPLEGRNPSEAARPPSAINANARDHEWPLPPPEIVSREPLLGTHRVRRRSACSGEHMSIDSYCGDRRLLASSGLASHGSC